MLAPAAYISASLIESSRFAFPLGRPFARSSTPAPKSQRRAVSYATPSSVATAGTLPNRLYDCRSVRSFGFVDLDTDENTTLRQARRRS